jgi:sugar phosphate isomerase/epimerase
MIVGFKTGPRNWEVAKKIVTEDRPELCEIWFRVDKADDYTEMLSWLAEGGVRIGLHHWGVALDSFKTNLMTSNSEIRDATIAQIKTTIDIGADIACAYVNIHPGALHIEKIDLTAQSQALVPNSATPQKEAQALLLAAAKDLAAYAREKKVLLTIETLPGAENLHNLTHEGWYDAANASLADIEMLAAADISIANDITHTGSTIARSNPEPGYMWRALMAFTRRTTAQARLLHINTMIPPFNGIDTHNGLLEADWQSGAWPSQEQIVQFLSLFAQRDDVFVIPEPDNDMQQNYRVLRTLVQLAEKS